MTDPDLVDGFFEELGQRGHEPLLDRVEGVGRFEITQGEHTDRWLVTVKGGHVAVSRAAGDADWVIRADRDAFKRVIHGDTGALAGLIRGTLDVQYDGSSHSFALLTRLFAGPPQSRTHSTDDQHRPGGQPL